MSWNALMDWFIQKNSLAFMTRCIVGMLMGEQLEEVFQLNRSRQFDDTFRFSTVAVSMAEIALGTVIPGPNDPSPEPFSRKACLLSDTTCRPRGSRVRQ